MIWRFELEKPVLLVLAIPHLSLPLFPLALPTFLSLFVHPTLLFSPCPSIAFCPSLHPLMPYLGCPLGLTEDARYLHVHLCKC